MTVKSLLCISLLWSIASLSIGTAQNRVSERSFRFHETQLRVVLDSLLRWYSVPLIYLDRDIDGKEVTAECSGCEFEDALDRVLEGQGLNWKMMGGQILLQKQQVEPRISFATISGSITDSVTGEWVMGANVLLRSDQERDSSRIHRWCVTNQFGFFSLRNIRPGSYNLVISSVGYRPLRESVAVVSGSALVCDRTVSPRDVLLQEITIEGQRSALAASEGISRGVYIRATLTDQNQYLLEGARIYNPSHIGGVMSTFNGDALRDVQVLAGGVPPYYGGRIGGILDVTLRNGTGERLSGSAGIGSLGSSLVLEGPLSKQTTFVVSGRRGYPDVFLPSGQGTERRNDLNSYEIMTKVSHRLAGDSWLFLSGYFGRDKYGNDVADGVGRRLTNTLHWGNTAASLRWIGVVSPSLFLHASAVYTGYDFDMNHKLQGGGIVFPGEIFRSDYRIGSVSLRAHAEYFYDEHHTVRGGMELVRHRIEGTVSEFSSQLAPVSLSRNSPWELSVYFQDQWRLVPAVSAELGARATSFVGNGSTFSAVDPRFSLLASLNDDTRLYSSLTSVTQFVHPYRHSGIFLFSPAIFLYPSTDIVPPSTSFQISMGMEKSFEEQSYTLAIETYYRATQKLHEFAFDTMGNNANDISDALLLGEGTVYGAELTVSKRAGNVTGSVRYSLAWSRNRFAGVNGGLSYTPRFDRRHEIYFALSYSPIVNWMVGMLGLLSPGTPSLAQSPAASPGRTPEGSIVAELTRYADHIDLNGGRFPGFQRLELQALHTFSWWGLSCQATFRLLNGYGLFDPFVWALRDSPDNRLKWSATFDGPGLFPLYPVVNLSVKF